MESEHRRQSQCPWIDVHGQHLGVMSGACDDQCTDTGTATDVHHSPDRLDMLLQMGFNPLREAVAIGSEKYRVGVRGGVCRVSEQQSVEARPSTVLRQR